MKLLSGTSHPRLARKVSEELGIPLVDAQIHKFPDQEISVEILETIGGEDVLVIQSTSNPVNDHLMELLLIIDALKRSSAKSITAVMPYFGYARQDRKSGPVTPISAKLVANLLSAAGTHRLLTFDLHTEQVQGFFDIPVDNLHLAPLFGQDIQERFDDFIIVSPHMGGVLRARDLADRLHADLTIVEKRRTGPGQSHVLNVMGDVKDKTCILFDDIIDSGQTIVNATQMLKEQGAKEIHAYVCHGVLSEPALDVISISELQSLTLSDTIDHAEKTKNHLKTRNLSISSLLAEAIKRMPFKKILKI